MHTNLARNGHWSTHSGKEKGEVALIVVAPDNMRITNREYYLMNCNNEPHPSDPITISIEAMVSLKLQVVLVELAPLVEESDVSTELMEKDTNIARTGAVE